MTSFFHPTNIIDEKTILYEYSGWLVTNRIIKKFIIEYKIQIRSPTSLTWRNCES
jgi:hypothetical protein